LSILKKNGVGTLGSHGLLCLGIKLNQHAHSYEISGLKAFVLALPELLVHARSFSEAPHTPPEAKKLYGYL
jgi:hypothetical protein